MNSPHPRPTPHSPPAAPAHRRATPARRLRASVRLARAAVHLIGGALTAAFVYPCLADARRLALKQRWSRQLLAMLGVAWKVGAGDTASATSRTTGPRDGNAVDAHTEAHAGNHAARPDGVAAPPPGLLVANHISFLDIFVINALTPAAFVAKREIRAWPLIGWLCAQTDTVFIERGSRRAAQATSAQLVGQLRAGRRVAVFPEGTTSVGITVLPFHGALFQSAIDAGCAVTPLALAYTDRAGQPCAAADYVGDTSLLACLWSIACADGLTARLRVLPPLRPPGDMHGDIHGDIHGNGNANAGSDAPSPRRQLAARAHHAVAHGLRQLRHAAPAR